MAKFWKKWFAKAEPNQAELRPYGIHIQVEAGQTLLEAALQQGVAFPHSCTVGTCASCKCHLLSGEVKPIVDFGYTLSKEELQAGYVLACQSVPLTSVVIEVEAAGADAPPASEFVGRIVKKVPLTADILAVTVALDRGIRYAAGQFATIRVDGLPSRSYSFADAPDRNGRDTITFFIRKVPGGAFTERLFADALDALHLVVEGPHGGFFLRPGDGLMVCLAGGSGLAPLMSLLTDARKKNIRRPCLFLFGARTRADLYMLDEIDALARDWLADFTFVPVLSDESLQSDWTGARGFVTDVLAAHGPVINKDGLAQAYMCGPPPMIDRAISVLTAAGVAITDIHYDKFTDTRPTAAQDEATSN